MKTLTLKWGAVCGLGMVTVFFITYLIIGGGPGSYRVGELIGYATIILSLTLIYIAIDQLRRQQPGESISFAKALLLGVMISVIAGVAFGIYNLVYVTYLEPDFMDQYYQHYIEQIQNSDRSNEAISSAIAALEREKQWFMNPFTQFFTMFLTIFVIGAIVSAFCAAIQSRLKSHK